MSDLDAALAAGRAEAEARMRDTVRVYRQAADVFDRVTGSTVAGVQTTYYSGKGRVKPVAQSSGEDAEAGEREVVLREYEVDLPWSTLLPPGVRLLPGDRIEVSATADPRLTGVLLWVTGVQYSAQSTAWRISTEDRT